MGSNMISGTIQMPVELQLSLGNAADMIKKLKSDLSFVSKDSKLYSGLENGLSKLEKKSKELAEAVSTPFRNQTEINQFGKKVNSLFDDLSGFQGKMSKLGFKDLMFSESDMTQVDNAKKKIDELTGKMNGTYGDFAKKAQGSFNNLFPKDAIQKGANYEQTIEAINQKITQLQENIKKAQGVVANLDTQLGEAQQEKEAYSAQMEFLESISDQTNPAFLSKSGRKMGANDWRKDYNGQKFGLALQAEELGLKDFVNQILDSYGPNTLSKLAIEQKRTLEAKKPEIDKKLLSIQSNKNETEKNIRSQQHELDQTNDIKTEMSGADAEYQSLQQQITSLNAALTELMTNLVQNNGFISNQTDVIQTARQGYDTARVSLDQMSSSMQRVSQVSGTLNNIRDTVSNFMNFYQVMNLVKNAVNNMISTVRELDSVMTQISIVTDMSQSDLWAQMDEYSNLANQYGTSIKGVYEVSQLFYQQGLKQNEVMELTEQTLVLAKLSNLDYTTATDYMTVA